MTEPNSNQISIQNLPEKPLHIYSKSTNIVCTVITPLAMLLHVTLFGEMYHRGIQQIFFVVGPLILSLFCLFPIFFKITITNQGIKVQRWRRKEILWENVAEVSTILNIQNESIMFLKMKDTKVIKIKGNRKTFQPIFESIKEELERVLYPDRITEMPVFQHYQLSRPFFILFISIAIFLSILTQLASDFFTGSTGTHFIVIIALVFYCLLFNLSSNRIDNNSIRLYHSQRWKKPRNGRVYWKDVVAIRCVSETKKFGVKIYSLEYSTNEGTFKAYSLNPKTYEQFGKIKDAFLAR